MEGYGGIFIAKLFQRNRVLAHHVITLKKIDSKIQGTMESFSFKWLTRWKENKDTCVGSAFLQEFRDLDVRVFTLEFNEGNIKLSVSMESPVLRIQRFEVSD